MADAKYANSPAKTLDQSLAGGDEPIIFPFLNFLTSSFSSVFWFENGWRKDIQVRSRERGDFFGRGERGGGRGHFLDREGGLQSREHHQTRANLQRDDRAGTGRGRGDHLSPGLPLRHRQGACHHERGRFRPRALSGPHRKPPAGVSQELVHLLPPHGLVQAPLSAPPPASQRTSPLRSRVGPSRHGFLYHRRILTLLYRLCRLENQNRCSCCCSIFS